jgi:hypothetical protein
MSKIRCCSALTPNVEVRHPPLNPFEASKVRRMHESRSHLQCTCLMSNLRADNCSRKAGATSMKPSQMFKDLSFPRNDRRVRPEQRSEIAVKATPRDVSHWMNPTGFVPSIIFGSFNNCGQGRREGATNVQGRQFPIDLNSAPRRLVSGLWLDPADLRRDDGRAGAVVSRATP